MSATIRVIFNGVERRLAAGLTVRHLLSPEELERVQAGEEVVVDRRGMERGLGGALADGAVFRLGPRAGGDDDDPEEPAAR